MTDFNEQRTPEWHEDRSGCINGSTFGDVQGYKWHTYERGEKKGQTIFEETTARRNLRTEIVLQRLGAKLGDVDRFVSGPMRDGIFREPFAIEIYELRTGITVEPCGSIPHPDIDQCRASPDGLVGEDGCIEVKNLIPANHLRVFKLLVEGVLPEEFRSQVQGHLSVTGRKWCDFCIYNPLFPDNVSFACLRVERDQEFIDKLNADIRLFAEEIQAEYDWIMTYDCGIPAEWFKREEELDTID